MKNIKRLNIVIATLLMSACAYHPGKYESELSISSSFEAVDAVSLISEPQKEWWLQFETNELVELMDEMNANNNDLAAARYRIDQSLALFGVQKSTNWPQVNGGLAAGQDKNHDTKQTNKTEAITFTASYEIDLWGLRDANNKSEQYRVQFQEQELNSIALTLQSLLSLQYFEALALKERVDLTERNLEATEQLYQRIKLKYDLGQSSRIELDQQKNVLLDQEKRLKILERDFRIAKRGIAVLLGRDKFEGIVLAANINDIQFPNVAVIQPASLLETRPDIRMAELNMQISDAELFAEKAKRWPNLTLTAEAGLSDSDLTSSLISSLTAPIFQGGRIKNQISAAEVDTNIQLTAYRQTVINAIQETLDTLTTYEYQQSIYDLQRESVGNNENLYKQSKLQYELGATDFLNLLAAQRSLFDAQDAFIQQKVIYLANVISIYKAMGNSPAPTHETIIVSNVDAENQ